MSKISIQKLKLLYLMKILQEKTDERHTMTINDIVSELSRYNVPAKRKSIYDDIESLRTFGMNIVMRKSRTFDYFLASRDFELTELKLMVDAVQTCRLIPPKKSAELIRKIARCTSNNLKKHLNPCIHVVRSEYASVENHCNCLLGNIDIIKQSLIQNNMLSFVYEEWSINDQNQFVRAGNVMLKSPVALLHHQDYFYLVAYDEKSHILSHYRVDLMHDTQLINQTRKLPNQDFSPDEYARKAFLSCENEYVEAEMQFHNSLAGNVIDYFGEDILVSSSCASYFTVKKTIAVTSNFLSWMLSFGEKATILSPSCATKAMKGFAKKAYMQYR